MTTDWYVWRMLKKGEIVRTGDERDMARDGWRDPADWQPATPADIGKPAPDPQYPAHRIFRRRREKLEEEYA